MRRSKGHCRGARSRRLLRAGYNSCYGTFLSVFAVCNCRILRFAVSLQRNFFFLFEYVLVHLIPTCPLMGTATTFELGLALDILAVCQLRVSRGGCARRDGLGGYRSPRQTGR